MFLKKCTDLVKVLRASRVYTKVCNVEVGARGFVGFSVYCLMKEMSFTRKSLNSTMKVLSTAAEIASCWIWSRRNKHQFNKA